MSENSLAIATLLCHQGEGKDDLSLIDVEAPVWGVTKLNEAMWKGEQMEVGTC